MARDINAARDEIIQVLMDYVEEIIEKVEPKIIKLIQRNIDRGLQPDGSTKQIKLSKKTIKTKKKNGSPLTILIDSGELYDGFFIDFIPNLAEATFEIAFENRKNYTYYHQDGTMGQKIRPTLDPPAGYRKIVEKEMLSPRNIASVKVKTDKIRRKYGI